MKKHWLFRIRNDDGTGASGGGTPLIDVILETEHDPRHEGKQLLEALSFCKIDIGNITFGDPEERVGPFPSVVPDWQEASRKLWIIQRF